MRRLINISRPCYDKFHRYPGWSGGGIHFPEVDQCEGGHIQADYEAPLWRWRLHRCNTCGVLVLPYAIRYADPANLISEARRIPGRIEYSRWERRQKKGRA
jgi:hypothetical protein